MKKVLIFSLNYYPRFIGGAEVAIKEITDRISPEEIEFHLITNRFDSTLPKEEKIGNVTVHRIGLTKNNPSMGDLRKFPLQLNKILFQFTAAWKAHLLNRKYHFDGTWAMMAHSCGVPAAIFKMTHPRVSYLLTLQEGDPIEYIESKMRALRPLFTRAFTKADSIQAISTFLAKWARARGFTGPLEVIPNAVNTAHFSQTYPETVINEVRDTLDKKMGDVFVITTSRLVKKNAVDDMISALPLLPENVHFIILGIGPDEEALKKLAEKLSVLDRVRFVGQVGHADMPKYLKASDIFIRASRSEGMGNSFVEAMAAGLPVIATQEGGIADFLFDEKRNPDKPVTGWAVDKDSPEQIAEAIKNIMAHPEKVRAIAATAKAMVEEKYDWNTVTKSMQRLFKDLLYTK
ncbi:MAG: glycosyltransferase family 4 protein [Minisyncoccia bacterium]